MALDRNRLLGIAAVAAGVLAGGWLLLAQIAAGKAEERLQRMVDDNGLGGQVRWASVSSSPFGGHVTLEEVVVSEAVSGAPLRIARVDITDVVDEERRKRVDLRISGVATAAGASPLGAFEFVHASGRRELPPGDLAVRVEADFDDDMLSLVLELAQPQMARVALEMQLAQIAPLERLGELGAQVDTVPRGRGGPGMAALGAGFAMLEQLGQLRIGKLSMRVEDDGYVERSLALHKRYSIPVSPAEGDAEAQREAAFRKDVEAGRAQCERDLPLADAGERKAACRRLTEFVSGERGALSLGIAPERPVAVAELIELGMRQPERAAALLRPRIE